MIGTSSWFQWSHKGKPKVLTLCTNGLMRQSMGKAEDPSEKINRKENITSEQLITSKLSFPNRQHANYSVSRASSWLQAMYDAPLDKQARLKKNNLARLRKQGATGENWSDTWVTRYRAGFTVREQPGFGRADKHTDLKPTEHFPMLWTNCRGDNGVF